MGSRKKQGFFNYYRKYLLIIFTVILLYFWFFTQPVFQVKHSMADLIQGFACILLFIGVIGRVFSSITIAGKKNNEVVSTEIYSVVRNPLYFFSFIMVLGGSMMTFRIELIILALTFFLICFYPMMKNEERYLEEIFGEKYTHYKNSTPLFIPNFSLYKSRKIAEIDIKLVTKTLFDAFIGLLIIPILAVGHYIDTILNAVV